LPTANQGLQFRYQRSWKGLVRNPKAAARKGCRGRFPLVCPHCGGAMRIIAFITDGPTVRDILAHLGEPTAPPRVAPARGPPLWEAVSAEHDPADPLLQCAPAFEFDQRLSW